MVNSGLRQVANLPLKQDYAAECTSARHLETIYKSLICCCCFVVNFIEQQSPKQPQDRERFMENKAVHIN